MADPQGPGVDEDLCWDTTVAFSINDDTPWDTFCIHLLLSIWCQRVAHAFSNGTFHLGVLLWHA